MADHGCTYVNMDEGWQGFERGENGQVIPNPSFKDMNAMTDYIHSFGLKAGIYSGPGPQMCNDSYVGSFGYEYQDAQTYANWGFDYLKYDYCMYDDLEKFVLEGNIAEIQKPYLLMKDALNKTNRDIVYNLCEYGAGDVSQWGANVGGNLWRVAGDLNDHWPNLVHTGFNQEAIAPYQKPGNWNDHDQMVIGYQWSGDNNLILHQTRLTPTEQYTHISLWAMLAAPMFISCDLTKLNDFTLNLLLNDEVLAINQDPLGKQGIGLIKDPNYQIMAKELEDGSKAVGLFNISETDLKITAPWEKLGITGKHKVRDAWRQEDLGVFDGKFESVVPPHGVMLVKVTNIN